ncbi:MAG: ankyrin repeat domain-containing protein [Gammaproteobacteria bacterium]|nr:ankyrin repeat domain-containing protein [Gammaproteobacteria bacterium]
MPRDFSSAAPTASTRTPGSRRAGCRPTRSAACRFPSTCSSSISMPGSRIACLLAALVSAPAWADQPWESAELGWLIRSEAPPLASERTLRAPEAFARIQADGNDVQPQPAQGEAARLLDAAARQDVPTVKALLEGGVGPNARDYWGDSPLMAAVRQDNVELVQILLDAGADTEARWRGYTPLALTAIKGNLPATRLLLRAGANPNRANVEGDAPLHAAIRKGHADIVSALAASHPDFRRYDRDGRTPLALATTMGQYAIADTLVDAGAPLEAGDKYAHTPLWLAYTYNDFKMVRLLLKHGADAAGLPGPLPEEAIE